ncbi:hypothetical protein Bbelb_446070 [Branchiostoma belcheri]|nr:hypothetical protein Bbelb_446070 [Branchiostoma belcheri]
MSRVPLGTEPGSPRFIVKRSTTTLSCATNLSLLQLEGCDVVRGVTVRVDCETGQIVRLAEVQYHVPVLADPRGPGGFQKDPASPSNALVASLPEASTIHDVFPWVSTRKQTGRSSKQGSPDIWRLHIPPNMSDFPQRLHKFTEALKGLVQSYPKVTVWNHRRLWRRNPNYFAPAGLHLSDLGNLQYYKSVRGALNRR